MTRTPSEFDATRTWLAISVVAALALPVTMFVGCDPSCREIETKPIDLSCADNAPFSGDLHFDGAGVYESFLADRCIPEASSDEILERVGAVDFSKNAVFVSVGDRLDPGAGRCLENRKAERVQVCESGLRVTFGDTVQEGGPCAGRYTVAFSLSRDDMRAAVDTP
jgi:hypothetical protein